MFQLKALHKDSIATALAKAERYRLLNEPWQAESICRDILLVEPDNQPALIALTLSLTDQFGARGVHVNQAKELLPRIRSDYERAYYSGIACERWAGALLHRRVPGAVYDWLREAMEHFEKAEAMRPAGNDDALLRWNTCVRMIARHKLHPLPESAYVMEGEA